MKAPKLLTATFVAAALLACVKREDQAPPAPLPAKVQTAPAGPTGKYGEVEGQNMLSGQGIAAFEAQGATDRVEVTKVPVTGQTFKEALRAKIEGGFQNPWDVQFRAASAAPVEAGDVLLATFYFRTEWAPEESGEGQTEFVFELGKDPWTKSVTYPVRASRDWKKVYVPFTAKQSYAAGEAQILFRLGYAPETIDIAGVTVENFGKKLALADLPKTSIEYKGSEADAAWRAAAAERIEKYRKADLTIEVKGTDGKPAAGVAVNINQTRQSFGFGTCVASRFLTAPGNDRYKQVVQQLFNIATLENNFKWVALEGDWGPSFTLDNAKKAVAWLAERKIPTRGHVLIWPGWNNLPKSLRTYEKNPAMIRQKVDQRIRGLVTEMRGKLPQWDVLNEPFDNHDLIDMLGEDEMVKWFKIARAADPKAMLFINDYAILSGGGGDTPHRQHYEKTIQFLLDKGAPLDGIGLQGHFGTSLTSPEDLMQLLDRYARFKKPLYVTEYDVVVDDEKVAADYTRDFYTLLFSHPAVEGIIMWGFWDGAHWKKNAPLFHDDWSLKPAGQVYEDLVLKQWRTQASGSTDATGSYETRGFLGRYTVTAKSAGGSATQVVDLGKDGAKITLRLAAAKK